MLNHNFVVKLVDSSGDSAPVVLGGELLNALVGGFSECSGIEMNMKVEEFNEGGRNGEVLKFRGRVSWSNITLLKENLASGTVLWDWYYSFIQGRGTRRDGVIILNQQRVPNNVWQFRRGIPMKYTGPSLNASQSNVAIESIEIAHEGIFQVPGVGLGTEAIGAVSSLLG